jgi:hypothetical protein
MEFMDRVKVIHGVYTGWFSPLHRVSPNKGVFHGVCTGCHLMVLNTA